MNILELPVVAADATLDEAWDAMEAASRAAVVAEEGGTYYLITAVDAIADSATRSNLPLGGMNRIELQRIRTAAVDEGLAGVVAEEAAIVSLAPGLASIALSAKRLSELAAAPRRCACTGPVRHPHDPQDEGSDCYCGYQVVCRK